MSDMSLYRNDLFFGSTYICPAAGKGLSDILKNLSAKDLTAHEDNVEEKMVTLED